MAYVITALISLAVGILIGGAGMYVLARKNPDILDLKKLSSDQLDELKKRVDAM